MNGTQGASVTFAGGGINGTQGGIEMTQTKGLTQSQQYVQQNIDKSLVNKKIEEIVQYILYCCLAEKKAIVKRVDINKHILKEHARAYLALMILVKKELNQIFGIDLIDFDDKKEKFGIKNKFQYDIKLNKYMAQATTKAHLDSMHIGASSQSVSSTQRYSNSQSSSVRSETSEDEFQMYVKYSLLMVSLSLIFMNNNELEANEFWSSLKRIDVNRNEKRHPFIGDVEKYFTQELVKEGYLEYEIMRGIEPPSYKFKWGYRAKLEISKIDVLNFVCKVYGSECKPNDWNVQFADAKNDEDVNGEVNDENDEMLQDLNNTSQMASNTFDGNSNNNRITRNNTRFATQNSTQRK